MDSSTVAVKPESPSGGATATGSLQPFEREVRLGLVLYGGVSLAVYMNGVANEFFAAVKGRGPYKLLKALTDSDIVVDIVSGTSAGGINGVLLAYALCNDLDFDYCGRLWREAGDMEALLRDPSSPHPPSLLRGETYFQEQLEDILRRMPRYRPENPVRPEEPPRRWESITEALDLFVTGTDYDGRVTTTLDSLGHRVEVKDHRRVFKLKFRGQVPSPGATAVERRNDFGTEWDDALGRMAATDDNERRVKALATVSRITASFPAAFPPTKVALGGPANPIGAGAAGLLQEWGTLDTRDRWFVDGGVLENKPFSTTIRDIYLRTGERRVDRKLFYVDPDPERFGKPRPAREPAFYEVVLASLVGLPGYQSIAGDLREIEERNARVRRYWEIADVLRYRTAGAAFAKPSSLQNDLYLQARVAELRDGFVESLLGPTGQHRAPGPDQFAQDISGILLEEFKNLSESGRARLLADLDANYAMRRLFHVTYFLYDRLYGQDAAPAAERDSHLTLLHALNRQLQVIKLVQWAIEELRDAIRLFDANAPSGGEGWGAIAERFRRLPQPRRSEIALALWDHVYGLFQALLDASGDDGVARWLQDAYRKLPGTAGEWRGRLPDRTIPTTPGPSIDGLRERLNARLGPLKKQAASLGSLFSSLVSGSHAAPPATASADQTLLTALEQATNRIVDSFFPGNHIVSATYHGFQDIDASLFPLEYLADLREKDPIDVVRVSPLDAQLGFSRKDLEHKLAGDAFFHFGGFFKRSWRANDILWGRLDMTDLLFECLLEPNGIERVSESPEGRLTARARLTGKPVPTLPDWVAAVRGLLPRSPADGHQRIAEWLSSLLSDIEADRRRAQQTLDPTQRLQENGILDVIVRAAQREIVETLVPEVVQDSVGQGLKWKTFKPVLPDSVSQYERADVDQLAGGVIKKVADEMLARAGPPILAGGATWSHFFESPAYRVGAEQIVSDVPTGVLVRIASQTLLLAKNILLGELEGRLGRIPAPLRVFNRVLGALLWILFGVSQTAISAPTITVINVALLVSSLGLLLTGLGWASSIWWVRRLDGGHELHPLWLIIFVVVPLLILGAQYAYFGARLRTSPVRARWRMIATAGFAALLAAIVVVGYASGHYAWVGAIATTAAEAMRSPWTLTFLVAPVALAVLLILARRFTRPRSVRGREQLRK